MARIPINLSTGTLKEQNLIVGIDLGTTNSLLAKMQEGVPVTVADFDKPAMLPSVVYIGQGGHSLVGHDALPYLEREPARTLYSIKRLMGQGLADMAAHQSHFAYPLAQADGGQIGVVVEGRVYTPIEISAMILRELKQRAEHRLKQDVSQAVITVPAYFNDAQRQATRDAGSLAGLQVLRIVNEPTAAALAYGIGLTPNESKTVVVYDLGGGTFDVTVLRIESGIFEVLSTHGDTYLGGDDIDQAIVAHWLQQHAALAQAAATNNQLRQQLRLQARAAKEALTTSANWQYAVTDAITLALDTSTLEQLAAPLVQRTLASCRQALQDAELQVHDIHDVVLVGGSTRMPYVKQQVQQLFQQKPHDSLNPDEVVALGAAIQADILAGNRKDLLLLDVTPLSLGIETAGGLMDVLIARNAKIPARAARQYTTSVDGQVNIRIGVYQGERELVQDNRKLAEFDLRGIPAMPAGLPKVEVAFLIDADGILRVTARELRSGVAQSIDVRPQYGLSDADVEQMLLDSHLHAQADVQARLHTELLAEARQLLYHSERFIAKHRSLFTDNEVLALQGHMQALVHAVDGGEKEPIRNTMDALDAYAKPLAERVMNKAVAAAMVGRKAQ